MKTGTLSSKGIYLKIFAVFSLAFFLLTRFSRVPLIYPDEAGYIGWAYKMLYGVGDGLRYLPGYSLFITLPLWLFESITTAFPAITVINSLMCGLFSAVLYRLCVVSESKNPLLVTIVVSLYPAVLLNANLAMSESLLSCLFVLLVYGVYSLSKNINSFKWIFVCVFLAGFLCVTHSRCIAILPALALSVLPEVIKKGSRRVKALYFSVLSLGALAATFLVAMLLFNKDTVNAGHLLKQIIGLFTAKGFLSFIGTLISQLSYLVISTFGFFAIGIYYTVKMYKSNKQLSLFLLLSFGFTAVLSAVFMYHHENPAHILYGRYNEYTVLPILAVGFSGFLKKGVKLYPYLISAVLCIITGLLYGHHLSGLDLNVTHTWGLYLYRMFFKSFNLISVYALFIAFAAVFLILSLKNRKVGVIALCVMFSVTLVFAEYDYFVKGASPRGEYPQLTRLLEDENSFDVQIKSGDSMVYPWEYYNYTVYNPYLKASENADLILSYDNLDLPLLGAEKYSKIKLYSKTADESQGVDTEGKPEATVKAFADGGKITVDFENNGRPWLCTAAADNVTKAVRGGLRVYKDEKLIGDLRADFKDNVYALASLSFDFPFEDGEYTVIAETVREFKFRGGETAYILVKKGDILTLSETEFKKEESVWEFNPPVFPGASGFYKYYVSKDGAEISGLYLTGNVIEIETFGERPGLSVNVFTDGKKLQLIKNEGNSYYFRLDGTAEKLRIESETYRFCDNSLEFLTTESNFKPVDIFVRGMKKVFDIRLDHRDYGVDIQKIKIYEEEL